MFCLLRPAGRRRQRVLSYDSVCKHQQEDKTQEAARKKVTTEEALKQNAAAKPVRNGAATEITALFPVFFSPCPAAPFGEPAPLCRRCLEKGVPSCF